MNKILLTALILVSITTARSQDFSFKLYFEDAKGNKDTVTLGYDPSATDGIDEAFGEENIIGTEFKDLDVRFTNEWEMRESRKGEGTIHLKKQISNYSCLEGGLSDILTMDIFTKHWPITMSWDTSIFEEPCRKGSFVTAFHPGGWWDVSPESDLGLQFLGADGSVTFQPSPRRQSMEQFAYVKGNDTVSFFWQAFNDSSIVLSLKSKVKVDNKLEVFPNPAPDKIFIKAPLQFGKVAQVELYSSLMQPIRTTAYIEDIDLSDLNKGLYFIKVINENGDQLMNRLLKE